LGFLAENPRTPDSQGKNPPILKKRKNLDGGNKNHICPPPPAPGPLKLGEKEFLKPLGVFGGNWVFKQG